MQRQRQRQRQRRAVRGMAGWVRLRGTPQVRPCRLGRGLLVCAFLRTRQDRGWASCPTRPRHASGPCRGHPRNRTHPAFDSSLPPDGMGSDPVAAQRALTPVLNRSCRVEPCSTAFAVGRCRPRSAPTVCPDGTGADPVAAQRALTPGVLHGARCADPGRHLPDHSPCINAICAECGASSWAGARLWYTPWASSSHALRLSSR